ncbi:MAG: hypothetical protein ABL962_04725 [Fimbriimonadaceae bacterium]
MNDDRAAKYRAGHGKEEIAINLAQDFLRSVLGVESGFVEDAQLNYECGDLRCGEKWVEVKGQGINPQKYDQNYVEIFEGPLPSTKHSDFAELAASLKIDEDVLSRVLFTPYTMINGRKRAVSRECLGQIQPVSISITNFLKTSAVIYANNWIEGLRYLCVYDSTDLFQQCREAILNNLLTRGRGLSNFVTYAVNIPYSDMIWLIEDDVWTYSGHDEALAIAEVKSLLA